MPRKQSSFNVVMTLDAVDNYIDVTHIEDEEDLTDLLVYLIFKSLTNILIPVTNIEKRYVSTRNILPINNESKLVDDISTEITKKLKLTGKEKPFSVDVIIRYPIILINESGKGNKNVRTQNFKISRYPFRG